jgi:hypothetical protein
MFTLRIWVFKSGVLKNLFIFSKHGTKANIRSTKMANNRHAYTMDVLHSYWTSDGLPLYCPWLKSRWFQTVSNCSCWQTSIGQPVLFEYGTGCEWDPSNQTLQYPVVTIKCYPWSAGSWQVFHIVGLVRRRISEAQRWQIIGSHTTGMSFKAIGRQMGYHYTVVSRLGTMFLL